MLFHKNGNKIQELFVTNDFIIATRIKNFICVFPRISLNDFIKLLCFMLVVILESFGTHAKIDSASIIPKQEVYEILLSPCS